MKLLQEVKEIVSPVAQWLNDSFQFEIFVTILWSFPEAPPQTILHSDYRENADLDRCLSVIIATDLPFNLYHHDGDAEQIVTVKPGEFVMFDPSFYHRGGPNESKTDHNHRFFIYAVKDLVDYPDGAFNAVD